MNRIVIAAMLLAFATSAYCQMYRWVDKDGKTQYSDQPPPADAQKKGVLTKPSPADTRSGAPKGRSDAAQSAGVKGARDQASFLPEEQTAIETLCSISMRETYDCKLKLKRTCPLEELVKGIAGNPNKGLKTDPRLDPNYEYSLDIRGEVVTISATARKPGLMGFFDEKNATRYNPSGRAGRGDPEIAGGVSCPGLSK